MLWPATSPSDSDQLPRLDSESDAGSLGLITKQRSRPYPGALRPYPSHSGQSRELKVLRLKVESEIYLRNTNININQP